MKKYVCNIIFLGVILITCLTGCSNQEANNVDSSDAKRMGSNITNYKNQNQKDVPETKENIIENKEITIAEFSTNIYNKEEARQTNVKITCGKLNETIVKTGDTFSFEAVVGKATTAERL